MIVAGDGGEEPLLLASIRGHEPGEESRVLDDACLHTITDAPMRSTSFPLPLTGGNIHFAAQDFVPTWMPLDATR